METIFTQKSVGEVLVIIAKNRNQSKCPSKGMVKHMVVHPYHGILLGKEKELLIHNTLNESPGDYAGQKRKTKQNNLNPKRLGTTSFQF